MKQKIEFKVTGIAVLKQLTKLKLPKENEKVYVDETGKEYRLTKTAVHHSPAGSNNKVNVLVSGPTKNKLEKLRKYMETNITGDVPTYCDAVKYAIEECCANLRL